VPVRRGVVQGGGPALGRDVGVCASRAKLVDHQRVPLERGAHQRRLPELGRVAAVDVCPSLQQLRHLVHLVALLRGFHGPRAVQRAGNRRSPSN